MAHGSYRAAINGVELYYEIHGAGSPLVMLHGGVNPSEMFGAPLAAMARNREVIAIHLRGHGFSGDADSPWSTELMADDVAALIAELHMAEIDIMGWSLGAGVALQLAIRHPELVRKLVIISISAKAAGNFPEVQAQFAGMAENAPQIAPHMAQSPLATLYPDIDWETMFRKTGEMVSEDYDWSAGIAGITAPTLLIFADADMMRLEHIVEFYQLLGGGTHDAGFD
ncbi:MAG: alpha/beta hydrolase, partial [Thermomicrobiales bacterium]